jgi:hypothetical protein
MELFFSLELLDFDELLELFEELLLDELLLDELLEDVVAVPAFDFVSPLCNM